MTRSIYNIINSSQQNLPWYCRLQGRPVTLWCSIEILPDYGQSSNPSKSAPIWRIRTLILMSSIRYGLLFAVPYGLRKSPLIYGFIFFLKKGTMKIIRSFSIQTITFLNRPTSSIGPDVIVAPLFPLLAFSAAANLDRGSKYRSIWQCHR